MALTRSVFNCTTGETELIEFTEEEAETHINGAITAAADIISTVDRAAQVDILVNNAREANAQAKTIADMKTIFDGTLEGLGDIFGTGTKKGRIMFVVPPSSITGTLQYFWIDSTGDEHDLSNANSNIFVMTGSVGLGDSEFQIEDDKLPLGRGALIRRISTNARKMTIPIYVRGDDIMDVVLNAQDLHDWFDTGDELAKRPGTFKIIRPDDTVRVIQAYYTKGLEGDTKEGSPTWTKYAIELYCPDPDPTDEDDTVVTKTVAQAAAFAVINQGRLPAYPIWKITGPFVNLNIRNDTLDKEIDVTLTLSSGHYLIIDTRPSELRPGFTAYDDLDANKLSAITPNSDFVDFMQPGSNTFNITFDSGTTADTIVELTYLARFRSLLR